MPNISQVQQTAASLSDAEKKKHKKNKTTNNYEPTLRVVINLSLLMAALHIILCVLCSKCLHSQLQQQQSDQQPELKLATAVAWRP